MMLLTVPGENPKQVLSDHIAYSEPGPPKCASLGPDERRDGSHIELYCNKRPLEAQNMAQGQEEYHKEGTIQVYELRSLG